jgi:hypothetical protein
MRLLAPASVQLAVAELPAMLLQGQQPKRLLGKYRSSRVLRYRAVRQLVQLPVTVETTWLHIPGTPCLRSLRPILLESAKRL